MLKMHNSRTFSSELDAESAEAAIRRFKDSHQYCCSCSLFGIRAELNFSSNVQVEEQLSTSDRHLFKPAIKH